MDNQNKDKTLGEAEQDFKKNMFSVFSENIPGAYIDEDGLICIPSAVMKEFTKHRRHKPKEE